MIHGLGVAFSIVAAYAKGPEDGGLSNSAGGAGGGWGEAGALADRGLVPASSSSVSDLLAWICDNCYQFRTFVTNQKPWGHSSVQCVWRVCSVGGCDVSGDSADTLRLRRHSQVASMCLKAVDYLPETSVIHVMISRGRQLVSRVFAGLGATCGQSMALSCRLVARPLMQGMRFFCIGGSCGRGACDDRHLYPHAGPQSGVSTAMPISLPEGFGSCWRPRKRIGQRGPRKAQLPGVGLCRQPWSQQGSRPELCQRQPRADRLQIGPTRRRRATMTHACVASETS